MHYCTKGMDFILRNALLPVFAFADYSPYQGFVQINVGIDLLMAPNRFDDMFNFRIDHA